MSGNNFVANSLGEWINLLPPILQFHVAFVLSSWVVVLPIGILVASFFKYVEKGRCIRWRLFHILFSLVGVLSLVAGVVFAFIFNEVNTGRHFDNSIHDVLGWVTSVGSAFLFVAGFLQPGNNPEKKSSLFKCWKISLRWFGRILFIASIISISTGVDSAVLLFGSPNAVEGTRVGLVVGFSVGAVLLSFIAYKFRQKRRKTRVTISNLETPNQANPQFTFQQINYEMNYLPRFPDSSDSAFVRLSNMWTFTKSSLIQQKNKTVLPTQNIPPPQNGGFRAAFNRLSSAMGFTGNSGINKFDASQSPNFNNIQVQTYHNSSFENPQKGGVVKDPDAPTIQEGIITLATLASKANINNSSNTSKEGQNKSPYSPLTLGGAFKRATTNFTNAFRAGYFQTSQRPQYNQNFQTNDSNAFFQQNFYQQPNTATYNTQPEINGNRVYEPPNRYQQTQIPNQPLQQYQNQRQDRPKQNNNQVFQLPQSQDRFVQQERAFQNQEQMSRFRTQQEVRFGQQPNKQQLVPPEWRQQFAQPQQFMMQTEQNRKIINQPLQNKIEANNERQYTTQSPTEFPIFNAPIREQNQMQYTGNIGYTLGKGFGLTLGRVRGVMNATPLTQGNQTKVQNNRQEEYQFGSPLGARRI